MAGLAERIDKFARCYWMGDCMTFVNPDNSELVSATYEVRAFASALIHGPLADQIALEQAAKEAGDG